MNLLVVGSGGREHAISKKLLESNNVENVYCAPGNDGMRLDNIQLVAISETDKAGLIDFAKKAEIAFVIVGPEVPLLEGVVDALEEAGIKAFGPKANAALIEGSKDFAKQFMEKYAIPTAASKPSPIMRKRKHTWMSEECQSSLKQMDSLLEKESL